MTTSLEEYLLEETEKKRQVRLELLRASKVFKEAMLFKFLFLTYLKYKFVLLQRPPPRVFRNKA